MTLEADLFTALKNLVGNRVAPVTFPQAPNRPSWPAIRYTLISTVPVVDLCGDGDDRTAETRIQLDVVAESYIAVRTLRLQVMAAMAALYVDVSTGEQTTILENSLSEYDSETKTFREILDYTIHGSSDSGNSPP